MTEKRLTLAQESALRAKRQWSLGEDPQSLMAEDLDVLVANEWFELQSPISIRHVIGTARQLALAYEGVERPELKKVAKQMYEVGIDMTYSIRDVARMTDLGIDTAIARVSNKAHSRINQIRDNIRDEAAADSFAAVGGALAFVASEVPILGTILVVAASLEFIGSEVLRAVLEAKNHEHINWLNSVGEHVKEEPEVKVATPYLNQSKKALLHAQQMTVDPVYAKAVIMIACHNAIGHEGRQPGRVTLEELADEIELIALLDDQRLPQREQARFLRTVARAGNTAEPEAMKKLLLEAESIASRYLGIGVRGGLAGITAAMAVIRGGPKWFKAKDLTGERAKLLPINRSLNQIPASQRGLYEHRSVYTRVTGALRVAGYVMKAAAVFMAGVVIVLDFVRFYRAVAAAAKMHQIVSEHMKVLSTYYKTLRLTASGAPKSDEELAETT